MLTALVSVALAGPVVLPVRRTESGHVLVDVDLGPTGTGTFLLDTGAARTAVSELTAARMGVPRDAGRSVVVGTIGGALTARLVKGRFVLGGVEVDGRRITVIDLAGTRGLTEEPLAGIVGRDFFEAADVALDLSHDELVIYDKGAFAHDGTWTEVPFDLWHGLVLAPVRLGSADAHAVIDTGANTSVVSRWGVLRGEGTLSPEASVISGAEGNAVLVYSATFDEVALGDVVLRDLPFVVCENRACPVGLGDVDRALLGLDALAHRTVAWSYARGVMYLSKPGKPAPR